MKPVYQTIFCNVKGNCYAAIIASLLEKTIEEVPNFIEQDDHHQAACDFLNPFGYNYLQYLVNGNMRCEYKNKYEFFRKELPMIGAINGFYDAVVYSPNFFDMEKHTSDPNYKPVCHAVIVDKNFNIIHDPNPNYKKIDKYPLANEVGYNGVIGVVLWNKTDNKKL